MGREDCSPLAANTTPPLQATCLGSELWADSELQAWWPSDTCVPVENGTWQMVVRLGAGEVPAELDRYR